MSTMSPFRADFAPSESTEIVPYPPVAPAFEDESWYVPQAAPPPFSAAEAAPEAEDAEEPDWEAVWESSELEGAPVAEEETGHPILSLFPLPSAVVDALTDGLWTAAIGLAIGAGFRDVSQLTNIVFYFRHPDLIGRRIAPEQRELAAEWISIRDRLVRPALQGATPAVARPPVDPPAPTPAAGRDAISSSGLEWPGATADQLAFMRVVYDFNVAQERSQGRTFVGDLPPTALAPIEGCEPGSKARCFEGRTDAAQAARSLLADARAALVRDGLGRHEPDRPGKCVPLCQSPVSHLAG